MGVSRLVLYSNHTPMRFIDGAVTRKEAIEMFRYIPVSEELSSPLLGQYHSFGIAAQKRSGWGIGRPAARCLIFLQTPSSSKILRRAVRPGSWSRSIYWMW